MSLRLCLLLVALALPTCAQRALTPAERAFTDTVMGPAIDAGAVRVVQGSVSGLVPTEIPVRPRSSCRERIQPPRDRPVPGVFAAMVLGERVHYVRRYWSEDFLAGYPESVDLVQAMRLAHELTHVWQWQNRDVTGYHPFRAGGEHVALDDPYLLEVDPEKPFLAYGYEQQGVIVEEFVCCRALDPEGARTEALHRLVSEVFPAAARRTGTPVAGVRLPWSAAETRGICS